MSNDDVKVEAIAKADIPEDVGNALTEFVKVAGQYLVAKMEKGEELTGSLAFAMQLGEDADPCILDVGVILNLQIIPKAALADESIVN